MVENLYYDEINAEDYMKIEKDLARFENEIANIIKTKILEKDIVLLTVQEEEKLKVFFAIMSFRSKQTSFFFGEELSADSKRFYSKFQIDGEMSALWKRNLGHLVNCRSLNEILGNKYIDRPIKVIFARDIFGLTGMYFSIVKCSNECERFVIGDCYPVAVNGELNNGIPLPLYAIHPLSPTTILLLVGNGSDYAPRNISHLRECILKPPILANESVRLRTRKLYPEEADYLNELIKKHAGEGYAFQKKQL